MSLLGYKLPEDVINFLFASYHHEVLYSHSQRGSSIRKCHGQHQGDHVLQTQNPLALELLVIHTHTHTHIHTPTQSYRHSQHLALSAMSVAACQF